MRAEITRAIEPLRKAGEVGHALDTSVTLYADQDLTKNLESLGSDLRSIFIVSQFSLRPLAEAPAEAAPAQDLAGLKLVVAKAAGDKCARCWIYSTELGTDPAYPDACPRCTAVLRELRA